MNVSLGFDPEVDDPHAVALQLAYAFGYDSMEDLLADSEAEDPDGDGEMEDLDGWTPGKMKRYVLQLKPTARKVLRAIAESAPEATMEAVQAVAGLESAQFAGSMSSFGFAVNNTRGVYEKPFTKSGQIYSMTAPVATLVLQVLDEAGL